MRPMPQPLSTQAAALSLTYSLSSNRASFRAAALENVALIQRQTLSTRHRPTSGGPEGPPLFSSDESHFTRNFTDYLSAPHPLHFPDFSYIRGVRHLYPWPTLP